MKKTTIILVISIFSCSLLNAQITRNIDSLFEASYENTIEQVVAMYAMKRGASIEGCDLPWRYNRNQKYFQNRVQNSLLNSEYGIKTGFLLYNYEGDTLHVFLLRSTSLFYGSVVVLKDKMNEMLAGLREHLGVEKIALSRTPYLVKSKTRGENLLIKKAENAAKKMSLNAIIDSFSNTLFPGTVRENLTGLEHLVIQPQHNIGLIPFCLLKPFKNQSYLIDSLSYSFSPHACNFETILDNRMMREYEVAQYPNQWRYLIVGNPEYSKKPYHFVSLPGAEEEADFVAKAIQNWAFQYCRNKSDSARIKDELIPLTGKSATYYTVKQRSESANIIYIASHAHFDYKELLEGSFVALAPSEGNVTGFWSAKEIQNTRMRCNLVILSACQTGVGAVYDGGFIQIGRSFFIAGADNVVCSLWSVDDLATRDLMIMFINEILYSNIENRMLYPAQSLRKAMLLMKKLYPDPAKWASFTVYGFSQ